jgi:glycyl-tRNA synthetase beta subunit
MNKYLLEIGTEELPYKFVNTGVTQLKSAFEKLLKDNNITFSNIKTFCKRVINLSIDFSFDDYTSKPYCSLIH